MEVKCNAAGPIAGSALIFPEITSLPTATDTPNWRKLRLGDMLDRPVTSLIVGVQPRYGDSIDWR